MLMNVQLGKCHGKKKQQEEDLGKRTIHHRLADQHQGHSEGLGLSPKMATSSALAALCKSSLESHNAILSASLTRDGLGLKLLIPP